MFESVDFVGFDRVWFWKKVGDRELKKDKRGLFGWVGNSNEIVCVDD